MSTYVLMRILESAPGRYDLGMRLLTLGHVDRIYDRLAARIERGQRVLDIGAGTGALTLRAARRGAHVTGIDVNAGMLEIAEARASAAGLEAQVSFKEAGVAELDREEDSSYDVVTSGLCLSELSPDERAYALRETRRILRPGGRLLLADEVRPVDPLARLLHWLFRLPLAVLTYLITQQTTRALEDPCGEVEAAGLVVEHEQRGALGSFVELVARRPALDA